MNGLLTPVRFKPTLGTHRWVDMLERIGRLFRDLTRRVEGYLDFTTQWGNARVRRPDLHPPPHIPSRDVGEPSRTNQREAGRT